jgi:hypothetical protein
MNSVFISYRREGGAEMARLVRNALKERGYKVFMDVEDLRSGPFKTSLLGQIESSNDIVLILTANSLDRSYQEGDWLRTEISHALKHNKNVIPVRARGFKWPASLPGDIAALPHLEGLEPSNDFFDASMDRLAKLLTAMPKKPKKPVLGWVIAIIGIVAVLALGITIVIKWYNNNRSPPSAEYQHAAGQTATGDQAQPGQLLAVNSPLVSGNGQFSLVYQGDANLVLYRKSDSKALWASKTNGHSVGVCIMQLDGNLVIYDAAYKAVFASNTMFPGSRLVVRSDGNVVIYSPNDVPVWVTDKAHP